MVRFSQNYGAQAAGGHLTISRKSQGGKTYIIHIRAHDNTGLQTKHHGIFLSQFYFLGTPKKANVDFNSNFWRFIF